MEKNKKDYQPARGHLRRSNLMCLVQINRLPRRKSSSQRRVKLKIDINNSVWIPVPACPAGRFTGMTLKLLPLRRNDETLRHSEFSSESHSADN